MGLSEITLNQDQQRAFDCIMAFIADHRGDPAQYITLGGYAGTGKTTLVASLAVRLKSAGLKLAFCTVSGKASSVLRAKLPAINDEEDYCGTIHGFIYQYIGKCDETNKAMFSHIGARKEYDVIFIDEASMVNKYIFEDIMKVPRAVKIFVGDHGQLPPVEGNFNIMKDPVIRLEKIHRQAEDNPIIKISMMAREEGVIPYGDFGRVIKTHEGSIVNRFDLNSDDVMVLVDTNRARQRINSFARERSGFSSKFPRAGEKVVNLMNDKKRNIYNGQIGRVVFCSGQEEKITAKVRVFDNQTQLWEDEQRDVDCFAADFIIKDDTRTFSSRFLAMQFGNLKTMERSDDYNLFDFGYALTTHKAQGSEWPDVILYENGYQWMRDWNKWLYTAVTRAKENLIIIKK